MSEKNSSPKGRNWNEVEKAIFTPEEIAASDLRVAMMIEIANARDEKEKLEEIIAIKA